MESSCPNFGPVRYTLGPVKVFAASAGKPYDVLYAEVESPDLHRLNHLLGELPHTDTYSTYKPHATIAYVKPGMGQHYAAKFGRLNLSGVAKTLTFSTADRQTTTVPLGADLATHAAAVSDTLSDVMRGLGVPDSSHYHNRGSAHDYLTTQRKAFDKHHHFHDNKGRFSSAGAAGAAAPVGHPSHIRAAGKHVVKVARKFAASAKHIATSLALRAEGLGIAPEDILDTAHDLSRITYHTGNWLTQHTGVTAHSAAIVGGHVLAYAINKVKRALRPKYAKAWEETKHPRGNKGNPGQFSKVGGGGASKSNSHDSKKTAKNKSSDSSDGPIDGSKVRQASSWAEENYSHWHDEDGLKHEIYLDEGTYSPPGGGDPVSVFRFVSFDKGDDRGKEGEWTTDRDEARQQGLDFASENNVDLPEWDGEIDQGEVERNRGSHSHVAGWNFIDDDGNNCDQDTYVEEGTYDPFPDRPGSEPVTVYRWYSSDDGGYISERGEWVVDEQEAIRGAKEYANDNHQEPKDDDDDEDDEDDDDVPDIIDNIAPPKKRSVVLGEEKQGKSAAKFELGNINRAMANKTILAVFGGDNEDEAHTSLVASLGMPDDATVKVTYVGKYSKLFSDDSPIPGAVGIRVSVSHPKMSRVSRFIGIDRNGRRFIRNEIIEVKSDYQGEGLGADIFSKQVESAAEAGIDYICTHAAGGKGRGMNGYYTWPRFGYDQEIDASTKVGRKILERFPDAESILDVMKTPEGRAWWKENGSDLYQAKFDLEPKSRSMEILSAYQKERAAKKVAKTSNSQTSKSQPSMQHGQSSTKKQSDNAKHVKAMSASIGSMGGSLVGPPSFGSSIGLRRPGASKRKRRAARRFARGVLKAMQGDGQAVSPGHDAGDHGAQELLLALINAHAKSDIKTVHALESLRNYPGKLESILARLTHGTIEKGFKTNRPDGERWQGKNGWWWVSKNGRAVRAGAAAGGSSASSKPQSDDKPAKPAAEKPAKQTTTQKRDQAKTDKAKLLRAAADAANVALTAPHTLTMDHVDALRGHLDRLTVPQLKKLARDVSLKVGGVKAALAGRLEEYVRGKVTSAAAAKKKEPEPEAGGPKKGLAKKITGGGKETTAPKSPPTAKDNPDRVDEDTSKHDALIMDQIENVVGMQISKLRDSMPPELQGKAFDEAVLRLADAEKVIVVQDADPLSFSKEERDKFVQYKGKIFTNITKRADGGTPNKDDKRTPEEKDAAKAKVVEDAMAGGTANFEADDFKMAAMLSRFGASYPIDEFRGMMPKMSDQRARSGLDRLEKQGKIKLNTMDGVLAKVTYLSGTNPEDLAEAFNAEPSVDQPATQPDVESKKPPPRKNTPGKPFNPVKVPKSNPEQMSWIKDQFGDRLANLSEMEQYSLKYYSSEEYSGINGALRGHEGHEMNNKKKRVTAAIDQAMESSSLPHDMVLYRGVGGHVKLEVGATVEDKAYVSTSISDAVSSSFAKNNVDDVGNVSSGSLLEIKARAGSRGVGLNGLSNVEEEVEILLPRNSKFKITGVRTNEKGIKVYEAEYLDER